MTKTPTDVETSAPSRAPRDHRAPRAPGVEVVAPDFESELEARRWHRKQQNRRNQLDAAWAKYPPGTLLYVSAARGIPLRTRAGIPFSGKATTTVEVSDASDADIAAGVKIGKAIVSPLGACAIGSDDGLIVHSGPMMSRADRAEADAKASEDRAELERLRAEVARLRAEVARLKRSPATDKGDGRPSRLAPDKGDDKATPAETFGGDDKATPAETFVGDDKATPAETFVGDDKTGSKR